MYAKELFLAAVSLIGGLGLMNYRLGRCYWRHETLMKWTLSLISAVLIVASALNMLTLYCPGFNPFSPITIIVAALSLMGAAKIYRRCFILGDCSALHQPDPNRLDEIDDISPMPISTSAK